MKVTNKITVHLDELRRIPPIDVMQGDAYTRELEFSLYSGGGKWNVPDGVSVSVAYRGDSGHGHYDTLPDGKASYTVSGNIVTVVLIPQVAAVAGKTMVAVVFTDTNGKQIATFGVRVDVAPNPALGANPPEVYYNLREWLGVGPLYVVLRAEDGAYAVDSDFAQIRAAYEQRRSVYCMAGTMRLPLAGISADTAMFSASNKDNIFRVVVKADGTVEHQSYKCVLEEDLRPAATDEIYFDITAAGEVSLKPEYRGAGQSTSIPQSVSDNGVGRAGTQNKELPEEIVIPEAVRGITVTSFAKGMFWGNRQVRRIDIPATVSEIPTAFCREAWNVTEVRGTEQVKILNSFAFYACGITRASFPALEVFNGTKHFSRCAYLAVANLGTTIRTIPEGCFEHCERLVDLRCSPEISVVGKTGFYMTFRLKELPFLGSLIDVGDYGFLISRVNVDAINPSCRFGVRATSKDFRGADYWTEPGEDATQVNTPLYSTFNQDNPLWKDKTIGNLARTWDTGCIIVCAAMAYSSLEKKDLTSPEEFTDAVYAANPTLKDVDPGSQIDGIEQYLEAVGYDVVRYAEFNTANLQALYDALVGGALVIHRCLGDATDGNHDVLIHGINADGEVLCVDPSSASVLIGRSDAITYSMPIQTRTRAAEGTDKDYFWIVRKN